MLPGPCNHAPQTMHATMLPDHVIIFPGSCNNAPESNGNFLQIMIMLPDHVTMFYIMLPGLGHVTTSCTHNQAVTYLPHAHTLGQSPPSHRHTLSGSHHPPTGTHSRGVTIIIQFLQFLFFSLSSLCLLFVFSLSSLCLLLLSWMCLKCTVLVETWVEVLVYLVDVSQVYGTGRDVGWGVGVPGG